MESILAVKAIRAAANKSKARILERFFKTGPGEYGCGDVFLGVTVPEIRAIARAHLTMKLSGINELLDSRFHEERLLALLIMVEIFQKADSARQTEIFSLYHRRIGRVNNWDLVDLSAPKIVGAYLWDKDKKPLYDLARSASLWERRIAMVATYYFIKKDDFEHVLAIATILLNDPEDLIRKAAGWMLREVGKKDLAVEEDFLAKHYRQMPRTMLRYAIEKFPEKKRKAYLKNLI